jgi:beta-lactamase regulating signal transducer with metallopeptidase domain
MTHFPEAIGWALLHFLWQATVIAVIYRGADFIFGKAQASARHSLALAALVCMLVSSAGTFAYEEVRLNHPEAPTGLNAPSFLNASATDVIVELQAIGSLGKINTGHLLQSLDCAWLAGILLLSLRTMGGISVLVRVRSVISPEATDEMAARFCILARRMNLQGRVSLRLHPFIKNPFVVGTFRSVVYLPLSALSCLTPDQIDAIVAHELAHVRRADYAWNLLQNAAETLFFFHPAVWWLGRILREQRELCCDDIVLRSYSDPVNYAKALLVLAENRDVLPSLTMGAHGHESGAFLLPRIARILGEAYGSYGDPSLNVIFRLSIPAIVGATVLCLSALSYGRLQTLPFAVARVSDNSVAGLLPSAIDDRSGPFAPTHKSVAERSKRKSLRGIRTTLEESYPEPSARSFPDFAVGPNPSEDPNLGSTFRPEAHSNQPQEHHPETHLDPRHEAHPESHADPRPIQFHEHHPEFHAESHPNSRE